MKQFLLIGVLFLFFGKINATHNRAGEITYERVSALTYRIKVTIYTDPTSQVPVDVIEVNWGDNSSDSISLTDSIGFGNDIFQNIYIAEHTYPSPGFFTVSVLNPNRVQHILNISNSVDIAFYLASELFVPSVASSTNSSPQLLYPAIDLACEGEIFIHNSGAWDPDGDSLAYRFGIPKGVGGLDIQGYVPVNEVAGNAPSTLSLDPLTGEIIWDSPPASGEYNLVFYVDEYRNGIRLGSVMRDMQIIVKSDCNNDPPIVEVADKICVEAGTIVSEPVYAYDPNRDIISFEAKGEPFEVLPTASITTTDFGDSVSALFTWQTTCDLIRGTYYYSTFKAKENENSLTHINLTNYKTLAIKIIPPRPVLDTVYPLGNAIQLVWYKSSCDNVSAYYIYRKRGSEIFTPGNCDLGMPDELGYELIAIVSNNGDTTFFDDNNGLGLAIGDSYCYRITVITANDQESMVSDEMCAELIKDVPIINKVSVDSTDRQNGTVIIGWEPPQELDTTIYPGPYRILLLRSINEGGFTIIDSVEGFDSVWVMDESLNTLESRMRYKLELFDLNSGRTPLGFSASAESIFLSIEETDNRLNLSWTNNVPWTNDTFIVFKKYPDSTAYDSIGMSLESSFSDVGLPNGVTFCYYIKSIGRYSDTTLQAPIINLSQKVCGTPEDNIVPCPLELQVEEDCPAYKNGLYWTNPNESCADDVIRFNIFRATNKTSDDFTLVYTVDAESSGQIDTSFLHEHLKTVSGCYAVTAVDSFYKNESQYSNLFCVETCPIYELPNIFTPNGDGINDLFQPIRMRYIEYINIKIYSRWGLLVFETNDPIINWDGTYESTGHASTSGVYYYVCDVYEQRLEGIVPRTITGYFQLNTN